MTYEWKTDLPGVLSVHSDECPVRDGRECFCGPLGFRASIRDGETNQRTVSSSFETPQDALTWQRGQSRSREGSHAAAPRTEVGALIDDFLQAAEDGIAQDSRGYLYTPDRLRALRGGLSYVDSELGRMAMDDVRRRHVQGLIGQLRGAGVEETRVVAVADALKELYSYAVRRDVVGFSPVVELDVPEYGTGAPSLNGHPQGTNGDHPSDPAAGSSWTSVPRTPLTPPTPPRHAAPAREEFFGTPHPFDTPGYSSGGSPTGGFPTGGFPGGGFPGGGFPSGGFPTYPPVPSAAANPNGSGPFSATFGVPGTMPDANYDATMQERWLWWTVRIIVIVFVLIALVLVAESV